jgi:hypothetical protein
MRCESRPSCESGPATPILSARHGLALARTSRCSRRTPSASSCACSIRQMPRGKAPVFRFPSTPTWSGTRSCQTCGRTSSTAIGSMGRTNHSPDTASTPTRLSWIHTRSRWRVRIDGPMRCSATKSEIPTPTSRQRCLRSARSGRRPRLHLGRRPSAAHAVAQHGHLRDARPRLLDAAPGHPAAPARYI